MKTLVLTWFFAITLLINLYNNQITTDLGPIQLITINAINNEFAPGIINISGVMCIGQSGNDIITFQGDQINYPSTGGTNFLMINSVGQVVTANEAAFLNCGNLIAAASVEQEIILGQLNQNYLNFISDSGDVTLQANVSGSELNLSADSHIKVISADLAPTENMTGYILLAVDRNGNLSTTHRNNLFKIGSDSPGNNYISIDNESPLNGINLTSSIVSFQGQNLAPASGSTNILTINSLGQLGIVLSTRSAKRSISKLHLTEAFDLLNPVSYSYLNSDKIEYGFIAEDLIENELLKHAVIYAPDGSPMSINYQTIFVALTADYLTTKKELKYLKETMNEKDEIIFELSKKCEKLEELIATLGVDLLASKKELKIIKTKLNAKDDATMQLKLKLEKLEADFLHLQLH